MKRVHHVISSRRERSVVAWNCFVTSMRIKWQKNIWRLIEEISRLGCRIFALRMNCQREFIKLLEGERNVEQLRIPIKLPHLC